MTEQLQREASESGRMCPAEGDWGTAVQEERILRRSFFERQHRFASALCDLSNTLRAQPKGGGEEMRCFDPGSFSSPRASPTECMCPSGGAATALGGPPNPF